MLDGTVSGCLNHPGVEAAFRCKQCMKPVCRSCVVSAPRGNFCSAACKEKFEAFADRAAALDTRIKGSGFAKLRQLAVKLILLVAFLAGSVWMFTTIEIPYVSDWAWKLRDLLGF